jgi:uncharacterized membrane protein YedE/YeeE
MRPLIALLSGLLFAVGLGVAGMTSPARVIGFLDVQRWDPSLLFTMIGALAVMFTAWRIRARRVRPLAGGAFPPAPPPKLDGRLVGGAALFGVGWGLSGFCPGPLLVSLGGGVRPALILVPAVLAGMLLHQLADGWQRSAAPGSEEQDDRFTAPAARSTARGGTRFEDPIAP